MSISRTDEAYLQRSLLIDLPNYLNGSFMELICTSSIHDFRPSGDNMKWNSVCQAFYSWTFTKKTTTIKTFSAVAHTRGVCVKDGEVFGCGRDPAMRLGQPKPPAKGWIVPQGASAALARGRREQMVPKRQLGEHTEGNVVWAGSCCPVKAINVKFVFFLITPV